MIIVIPARLNSGRVPRKMLEDINGKSVIQHTYENVCKAECADLVVVAVDSEEVALHVNDFGARFEYTSPELSNGTERVAAVAESLELSASVPVINVQGDNWNVSPDAIDEMAGHLKACSAPYKHVTLYSMCEPINEAQLHSHDCVKVVRDSAQRALFFTRYPIRGAMLHCGIYGYHTAFLQQYCNMRHHNLERAESLEQMRVLENGLDIMCPQLKVAETAGHSINAPADLDYARRLDALRYRILGA